MACPREPHFRVRQGIYTLLKAMQKHSRKYSTVDNVQKQRDMHIGEHINIFQRRITSHRTK